MESPVFFNLVDVVVYDLDWYFVFILLLETPDQLLMLCGEFLGFDQAALFQLSEL